MPHADACIIRHNFLAWKGHASGLNSPACMQPVVAADRQHVCIGTHSVGTLSPEVQHNHMEESVCSLLALLVMATV